MDTMIKIAPVVISLVSFVLSLVAFCYKMPRVRIGYPNDFGAYYGATKIAVDRNEKQCLTQYVAAVEFRIYNRSPNAITIADVNLMCKGKTYWMARCDIEYWESVEFFFYREDEGFTTDGCAINYGEAGVKCPCPIQAYETKDIIAVFISFPKQTIKNIPATLIVDTAVGKKKKQVKLKLFDDDFACAIGMDDFVKSQNSR